MGATLIVDDSELAPVSSDTHLPTSEGWKTELAYQREEFGRSEGMTTSIGYQGRSHGSTITHYDTSKRIGRILVQTPLDVRLGFGTQPRYGDLRVESRIQRSD